MLYVCVFFFFNDTATTEIYTLSLHDALPISISTRRSSATDWLGRRSGGHREGPRLGQGDGRGGPAPQEAAGGRPDARPTQRRRAGGPKAGCGAPRPLGRRDDAPPYAGAGRGLGAGGARAARGHL